MNKIIQTKLNNILKAELQAVKQSDEEMSEKVDRVNTIANLKKIVDNYDELEPVLKKYFEKKAQDKKWGGIDER